LFAYKQDGKMSQLKDIIPFVVLGVQCYIFYSVESLEIKLALGIVFLFQLWQRSRGGRRVWTKTDQEEEQQPKVIPRKKRRRQNSD